MAKCKDCLHYEACSTFSKIINAARDVEQGCEHFKDRTEVVEVVRCKDCKHRRIDEDYVSGHYCVKRPSNGGYFCEDNDFCSYGERREGE